MNHILKCCPNETCQQWWAKQLTFIAQYGTLAIEQWVVTRHFYLHIDACCRFLGSASDLFMSSPAMWLPSPGIIGSRVSTRRCRTAGPYRFDTPSSGILGSTSVKWTQNQKSASLSFFMCQVSSHTLTMSVKKKMLYVKNLFKINHIFFNKKNTSFKTSCCSMRFL